ncbi:LysR family transcriptional regulator [Paucibacter sp. APW11]|uniref:LysR family transcriptional regulator n=1 Tax=Roseateles aquae TaxID=3077235 RepID=A0ABU3PG26_9BURK|nr:LysR family transcriptional regulator [Paucibacter sp. APW11]MDT9001536.1 LysR family transcriptional regulator [Paucibacter sp. APW11]
MNEALSGDRLGLLQTFVRIVEAGSLSAAASQLGTTQPTVSRRLRALEHSLGQQLAQRSTHAWRLTEAGRQCYERAKLLLEDWSAMQAQLRGAQDEPEGLLRVMVPHALGQLQLMGPLLALLRCAPALSVEWLLNDQAPNFSSHDLDCAIRVGAVTDPSVVALQLGQVPRILVAAPELLADRTPPSHPAALADWPWLALGSYYRHELQLHDPEGRTCKLALRPRLITDSLFALRHAAVEGLGVCAMSAWMAQPHLADGSLQCLLPGWQAESLPVHLLYPYQRYQTAKLRHFISAMRDSLSGLSGLGRDEAQASGPDAMLPT